MTGFVLLHRGLIGNPQFRGKDDEYAAIWLVARAAWERTSMRVGRASVTVERGQWAGAISYLAQAWECSKAAAHGRVRHLEKNGFIRTEARTDCTVITICKYSDYQVPPNAARTQGKTEPERCPNAARTNLNEGNQGKEDSVGGGRARTDACEPAASGSGTAPNSEAATVAARFIELRAELWPDECGFPAPTLTLQSQAAGYLKGAPIALVTEIMERGMRTAASQGKPATGSLKAFNKSMATAIANHKHAEIGGAYAPASHNRPHTAGDSAHEALFAGGAAVAARYRQDGPDQ